MVRKMAYVGFSYLLGLFFASFFTFGINIAAGAVFIVIPAVILIFSDKTKTVLCVCMISLGTGILFCSAYDRLIYDNVVKYNGFTIEVSGVISDHDEYARDINRYFIKGSINGETDAGIICYGTAKSCKIGDEIYVKGKASTPKTSYVFDSKSYYKAKGVYLMISSADEVTVTPADRLPVKRILCRYRDHICGRMSSYLDTESSAVVKAMLFGDKSGFEDSTYTLLARAGIVHVMAVSGIHLAIVCALFGYIIRLIPANKYIRFLLTMIPIALFTVMSGASVSVLRAAVMLALVYAAKLFERTADVMNSLGIAAIILTLPCPFAVRDASFMLSFAGVIGIGAAAPAVIAYIEKKRGKKAGRITKPLISSACAAAVIFPVSFLFFNEISVVSPVTNFILMPFCTVILVCGVLTAATGGVLAAPLMKICGICCHAVLYVSKFIGSFQLSYIPLGYKFTGAVILIALAASAAVFAASKKPSKAVVISSAMFGMCIVCIMIYRFLPSDHITAAVLTDGKGASSIVIHDKKNASVIDLNKGGKAADYAVKYLTRNGIGRVELLAMTVDDNTSETVYMNALELFDVGTALIPLSKYDEHNVSYALHTEQYDTGRECTVEMPLYTMILSENNTVTLDIGGYTILACNGKKDNDISGNYDVVIDYAGTSSNKNISGNTFIFTDSGAEASVNRENTVYIGESAVIKIYKNKIETEAVSCGFGN